MILHKGERYNPKQQEEVRTAMNAYEDFIIALMDEMDITNPPLEEVMKLRKRYDHTVPGYVPRPRLIEKIDEKLERAKARETNSLVQ